MDAVKRNIAGTGAAAMSRWERRRRRPRRAVLQPGGEPFWGQDRLDLLEAAILSGDPPVLPPARSEL
ncbi:hypothetical protein GCM10010994_23560 [Chelatococcus reniformis]|uniref:Uncharacterized protein n=1 Tax=Chelatococcus reniformis TaxID=1494448 RepID=A0A916U8I1_9HYPH|nr:hypothetical protein GCM10010994_23560 [Chelatococcus reniformis]